MGVMRSANKASNGVSKSPLMVHEALCDNRAGALLNTVKTQRTGMQNLQMAPDGWWQDGGLCDLVLPRGTVWKREN